MITSGNSRTLNPLQTNVTLSVDRYSINIPKFLIMSSCHEFVDPLFDFAIETKPAYARNADQHNCAEDGKDTEESCDVEEHFVFMIEFEMKILFWGRYENGNFKILNY